MIIGVFGPRDKPYGPEGRIAAKKREYYDNYAYISDSLQDYDATKIITGGGLGVEQLALRYANEVGIEHLVIPPMLAVHGHDAWSIRNKEIIELIDVGVLFWDGQDKYYHELMAIAAKERTILHLRHVE